MTLIVELFKTGILDKGEGEDKRRNWWVGVYE